MNFRTLTVLCVLALAGLQSIARAEGAAHDSTSAQPAGHEPGAKTESKDNLIAPDMNTAIWVVVIFLVMLVVLYPTAWKNVLAGLKSREERIRGQIAQAEQHNQEAQAKLRQYEAQLASAEQKVQSLIERARADAEQIATQIRLRAQQEAEEARERTARDIEAASKQAVRELYEQAAELSTLVAEKILRRNLNVDDQRDLVRRSLDEMQNVNRG